MKKIGHILFANYTRSSKKGTLGIEVMFNVEGQEMPWTAWLGDPKSIERSMKILIEVLGFNGDNEPVPGPIKDVQYLKPEALNTNKEIELTIENEEYKGKLTPKIQWPNNPGGAQFANLTPEIVKSILATSGFKAAFLAASKGVKKEEEVPF